MKKFFLISMVLVLAIVFILPASGKKEEATADSNKVVLDFWTWRPEDKDFYDMVIERFEKANPSIEVNQLAVKSTEYNTMLLAALQGGGGPDVFMGRSYGALKALSDSKYLVAMDDLYPELKNFNKSALDGCVNIDDNKHYGVPALSQVLFVYYNKKVYKELNLTPPKTWDEFIANLQACKKADITPLANGTKDPWTVETLLGGVGPNLYGANDFYNDIISGKTNFMDKRFVNAVKKLKELTPYMPELYNGVGYSDMQSSFYNEMAAHMVGGSYEAGNFSKNNPELEYGIFPVPGVKDDVKYVTYYADMNWVMNANSKKQDAALEFIKFLSSKEVGKLVVNELKMISSVPNVDASAQPFVKSVLDLMANSTNYIFLVPFRYNQPTGSSLWQSNGQGFVNGNLTAEQACQNVQDGIATYYKPFQK